ncbi:alginate export family protein [Stakelama marina]|uniref:Alginate export family protein n=1 Tax=Stakelama marina TaxID=2826939 RepID=A0A8T4IEV7_9SPHN|nr:alginate export family protein [Stakelama marina]MBR0552592.1 alginate export family protein [Stakelama marina]
MTENLPVGSASAAGEQQSPAPSNWSLKAGIRTRFEAIGGQFRPDAARSDQALLVRSSLAALYEHGAVRMGAEIWDARAYLEQPNSSIGTGEVNTLALIQAYGGVALGDSDNRTTIDFGRFTMNIGSRRLVSRQNFRNSTNAYTGVHLHHDDARGRRIDAFWAMPQRRLPDDAAALRDDRHAFDKEGTSLQYYGVSAETPIGRGIRAEVYGYGLSERDAPGRRTHNRHLWTPGLRLHRPARAGTFDLDIELSGQLGTARKSADPADRRDLPVRAGAAHVEVGRRFAASGLPRVAVGFDYGSGDGTDRAIGRFDRLFGARRFDYGPTSLFGVMARENEVSASVAGDWHPALRWRARGSYRAMWLARANDSFAASGIRDRSGQSGRFAGHLVEARLSGPVMPHAKFEIGAAYLAKGRFLRHAPNAPATGNTRYAYAQIELSL